MHLLKSNSSVSAAPLETMTITGAAGTMVTVKDAGGREYFRAPCGGDVRFTVGGKLGQQTVESLDARGAVVEQLTFQVDAATTVRDDTGRFTEFFDICNRTLRYYAREGEWGKVTWRGRDYPFYVYWILDHSHTAKGMQFFSPHSPELVDLLAAAQRPDGMIWSFVTQDPGPGYFDSAYGPYGYAIREGGCLFVRQPDENHPEYNFVDTMYLSWKGSGNDAWLRGVIDAAIRALDYSVTDRARWSTKFGLLKRGYCIDSWDFQVHDKYFVEFPLGADMLIDPDKTKFGVFFGDNTGYALACDQLSQMLAHLGRLEEARKFAARAQEIRTRLAQVAWNGRFYRHRVEEDPSVVRDLGVDEAAQIAMSNAYTLNRGADHSQCVAILRTYQDLKANLPPGSPGEWYAIYPIFERGFDYSHPKWQYMNGGVHGHAAGELARGAFAHGFEDYGADILERLRALGRSHGGVIHFALTGADQPEPAPQVFASVNLNAAANSDLWAQGGPDVPGWMHAEEGNDMRNLPVGRQTFTTDPAVAAVPWQISDPKTNGRRGTITVGPRPRSAQRVEVPIDAKAGAVYLLHTVGNIGASNVAGAMTFNYGDGRQSTVCIMQGQHVAGWWFPSFPAMPAPALGYQRKVRDAGVAWRGPNLKSRDVGVCWAAIQQPHPDRLIKSITFEASPDGAIYAVLGLTLADRMPYHKPDPVSFGGPDNWPGGNCMLALVEGLAGVVDAATRFARVTLSPRWTAAGVAGAAVTVRYGLSDGYVAYDYRHDAAARRLDLTVTGSGAAGTLRLLLPATAKSVTDATLDGHPVAARLEQVEHSRYAVIELDLPGVARAALTYA